LEEVVLVLLALTVIDLAVQVEVVLDD